MTKKNATKKKIAGDEAMKKDKETVCMIHQKEAMGMSPLSPRKKRSSIIVGDF
jgi:hypothetical protein